MRRLHGTAIVASLTLWISLAQGESSPNPSLPADISIRMTSEGPIFATAEGLSLYFRGPGGNNRPSATECTVALPKSVTVQAGSFTHVLPQPDHYRSCAQQWPALTARPDAVPFGKWSIVQREDGQRQWAYEGRGLYRSLFDRVPGDLTVGARRSRGMGAYPVVEPAVAPIGLPGGITTKKLRAGIALASSTGQTLYTLDRDKRAGTSTCTGDCLSQWNIVRAPSAGGSAGDWSAIVRDDGLVQWAFRGKPIYTQNAENDAAPTGARPVMMFAIPPAPDGIATRELPYATVYTTADGMTLYSYFCSESDDDELICDRPGAPPVYIMALCGGTGGDCSKNFKPLEAAPTAQPAPPLWSIVRIDPRNPVRVLKSENEGVRVWAYYGRPLYTYVDDKMPGDFYGHGYSQEAGGGWYTQQAYGSPVRGYEP